jgi:SpoIID/LytB domain protein
VSSHNSFSQSLNRLCVLCVLCGYCVLCDLSGSAQDRGQTDTIRVGVLRNGSYEVVTLPLETYVARVLVGEALPGSEPAAYEALAIAIRTYTLANRGKHRADGFDVCDQTHCQVMRTASPVTERAAAATAGQVILYKGEVATIYYSASCGGRTEKPSNVWPGALDVPYLPSRADDGCGGAPQWSTELSLGDLQRALQSAGYRGFLQNFRIASHNESGRAAEFTMDGMVPSVISGQDLRAAVGRTLGWQYIQSTAFDLQRSGDRFRLRGHGAGHGVGMCVIGSTKLAIAGETAAEILQRYFPGTEIGRWTSRTTAAPSEAPPVARSNRAPTATPAVPASAASVPAAAAVLPESVAVSLPEGDEGERAVLAGVLVRERDAVAATLGVAAPPKIVARFHPTTDAYERAARMPWFTIGTSSGTELQFVPLAVLRQGGVLERAVRHQLVHVLADSTLADRPLWVREGAALHFADNAMGPGNRGVCPSEAELLRPASAGALNDAYARARACFERELSAGRSWKDVR